MVTKTQKDNIVKEIRNSAGEMVNEAKSTVKKSTADWMDYVSDHPFQAMAYGVVAFFALKGLLKD